MALDTNCRTNMKIKIWFMCVCEALDVERERDGNLERESKTKEKLDYEVPTLPTSGKGYLYYRLYCQFSGCRTGCAWVKTRPSSSLY